MRVCAFAPDLSTISNARRTGRLAGRTADSEDTVMLLTNSWAERSGDTDVYATGGTGRLPMRLVRAAAKRSAPPTRVLARGLAALVASDLIEGLRATDPDVVLSLDPTWTSLLQATIDRAALPWDCVERLDGVAPSRTWRRYDPSATVSIVLPTYNGVRLLRRSIESCLAQTFPNIQLVVVDDGSTVPVRGIVESCSDRRVQLVRHATNLGLPHALNTGFGRVSGDYCTWTSDDNFYTPDAIEQMVRFLQTYPDVDFVYAESYAEHEGASPGTPLPVLTPRPPESLQDDNWIGGCFMYKRHVFECVGAYDPAAVLAEDYDYWIRVSKQFRMQRLFKRLYTYRFHPDSLTSRHSADDVARQARRVRQTHGIG